MHVLCTLLRLYVLHHVMYVVVYVVIVLPVLTPDVSLTPHTLLHAVSTVRRLWNIGGLLQHLGVPGSVIFQINRSQSYSSEDEKRMAGLQYCLQTLPGVSWGRIAGVLWEMEEHTALETVRQYLPPKHGEDYTGDNCMCVCMCVALQRRAWEFYIYNYTMVVKFDHTIGGFINLL